MKERATASKSASWTEEKGIHDPRRKGTQIYFSRSTTLTVARNNNSLSESRNRRSAFLWSFLRVGQRAIAAIFPPSPAQRAARFANTIGGRPTTVEQSVTKSRPPYSRPRLKPSRKKKGLLCAGGVRSKNGPKPTQSLVAGIT